MAISDLLSKLIELKNQLVVNLKSMGVTADESEKLNTLVPKVLECGTEQNVEWVDNPSTNFSYIGMVSCVNIPEGVTEIGSNVFNIVYTGGDYRGNDTLKKVVIPNSCTSIGDKAFIGCTNLSIIVPGTVSSIGVDAFTGIKCMCPQKGCDTTRFPWSQTAFHDFNDSGICKNCLFKTPILLTRTSEYAYSFSSNGDGYSFFQNNINR